MELKFRTLYADEIECRVQSVRKSRNGSYGFILLLYKDARCDQNILDETVGALNWQREHRRDNANCVVSIWDEHKATWVSKEDTGTESNTEAAKGLASDSFKRACFNWGVGRELYSAPFIWIPANEGEVYEASGRPKASASVKFSVQSIAYDEKRRICALCIVDSMGEVRYTFPKINPQKPSAPLNEGFPKDAKTISPSQAAWVSAMCQNLYGEKWQAMLKKATGYQYPHEIPVSEFEDIRRRLEQAENTRMNQEANA